MTLDDLVRTLGAIEVIAFIRPPGPRDPGGKPALLVIVPDDVAADRLQAIADPGVVPCRAGWYAQTRGRPGTVAHAAATAGRRLYPR
ncbi:MAG: hypothetical protein J0H82_21315 [Alphaproteobacteria bacterium]|nr:hypothetical protein [Alphaproteobacteria bacterium]